MTPNPALGVWCPQGGQFYVCLNSKVRFFGCCLYDPCEDGSGHCRVDSLTPTSYNAANKDLIMPQTCEAFRDIDNRPMKWWLCENPPYFGCCSHDPCYEDKGCPAEYLSATVLSDYFGAAEPFAIDGLPTEPGRVVNTSGNATGSCPPGPNATGKGHPCRDILIAIPVTAGIVLIIALFFYLHMLKKIKLDNYRETEAQTIEMGDLRRPVSGTSTTFMDPRPAPIPGTSLPPMPSLPPYPGPNPDFLVSYMDGKGGTLDDSAGPSTESTSHPEASSSQRHPHDAF